MSSIRQVELKDKDFWFQLDEHLSEAEFENKVRDAMGYVIWEIEKPVGILRYNLFWDNTPFCTMLFVVNSRQGQGYGKKLMDFWEKEMQALGYGMVMTSTRADEEAQHFYRKLGYQDAGGLLLTIPGYEQPFELFLTKQI